MPALLYSLPDDVHARLLTLNLEEAHLLDAVHQGYVAFISCTENHPPVTRGVWSWGETVRALRDRLLPQGWTRSDNKNYSTVIHPSGRLAIAVATGDEGTGCPEVQPSTKSPKGSSTLDAVSINQQLNLFMAEASSPTLQQIEEQLDEKATWILLVHRSAAEVRCELSLPSSMGPGGFINGWQERILLRSIPLDDVVVEVEPSTGPEIHIDVLRRAAE
ncbi:MAG: hypothetical protein LZF60_160144 [Nitrospira sp.]|nr:MAG: hypothetical protein LZF60_160144 [Nitrospira sp.]